MTNAELMDGLWFSKRGTAYVVTEISRGDVVIMSNDDLQDSRVVMREQFGRNLVRYEDLERSECLGEETLDVIGA